MTNNYAHAFAVWLVAVVLLWQAIGAAGAFTPVGLPKLWSRLIPILFAAILFASAPVQLNSVMVVPGFAGLMGALALFEWARRSVRGRLFSYVFSDDQPGFLWTAGPFAYVRNPFYASYLLTMASANVMLPSVMSVIVLAATTTYFVSAALFEERKFARSPLAAEYEAYKRRTGRFLPRLRRRNRRLGGESLGGL